MEDACDRARVDARADSGLGGLSQRPGSRRTPNRGRRRDALGSRDSRRQRPCAHGQGVGSPRRGWRCDGRRSALRTANGPTIRGGSSGWRSSTSRCLLRRAILSTGRSTRWRRRPSSGADATRLFYLEVLRWWNERFAAAIAAVAAAPSGAVVVHCAVGKDRTGLISALLLRRRRGVDPRYRGRLRAQLVEPRVALAALGRRRRRRARARAPPTDGRLPCWVDAGRPRRSRGRARLDRGVPSLGGSRRDDRSPLPALASVADVLAIFGPTASGKTAVAEAVAERIPAELVSADSMQVYRGLPILTNQSAPPARLVAIWPLSHEASRRRVPARSRTPRSTRSSRRVGRRSSSAARASTSARRSPTSSCRRRRRRARGSAGSAFYDERGRRGGTRRAGRARSPRRRARRTRTTAGASSVRSSSPRRARRCGRRETGSGRRDAPPDALVGLDVPQDDARAADRRADAGDVRGRRGGGGPARARRRRSRRPRAQIMGLREVAELPRAEADRGDRRAHAPLRRLPAEVAAPHSRRRHDRRGPAPDEVADEIAISFESGTRSATATSSLERAELGRPLEPRAARGGSATPVRDRRRRRARGPGGRRRRGRVAIWNPDGSRAELSGNGTRIAARGSRAQRRRRRHGARPGRRLRGARGGTARSRWSSGAVDVSAPETIEVDGERVELTPVSVGNPHAVVRREPARGAAAARPAARAARALPGADERPARPGRRLHDDQRRSSGSAARGRPSASGSSAVAVAAAAIANGWCESPTRSPSRRRARRRSPPRRARR